VWTRTAAFTEVLSAARVRVWRVHKDGRPDGYLTRGVFRESPSYHHNTLSAVTAASTSSSSSSGSSGSSGSSSLVGGPYVSLQLEPSPKLAHVQALLADLHADAARYAHTHAHTHAYPRR
jgi:hypothetical protein